MSKAFDTIGHSILVNKLFTYGIKGKENQWFADYLFNRRQNVELNGVRSEPEPILTGVPQGSILGPLLFILFYNDLADHIVHSEIIIYADDTVIFFAHKDPCEIERMLTEDMERIGAYSANNELIINTKKGKTEVMLFGSAKRLKAVGRNLVIMYANSPINFVSSYKYLGIIVDDTLTLAENFNRSYKSASSRLRLLERMK